MALFSFSEIPFAARIALPLPVARNLLYSRERAPFSTVQVPGTLTLSLSLVETVSTDAQVE